MKNKIKTHITFLTAMEANKGTCYGLPDAFVCDDCPFHHTSKEWQCCILSGKSEKECEQESRETLQALRKLTWLENLK